MFVAARNGHLDVVRHLVEVGADKDLALNNGATPLFVAARNGHLDVVRHLVKTWCWQRSSEDSGNIPSKPKVCQRSVVGWEIPYTQWACQWETYRTESGATFDYPRSKGNGIAGVTMMEIACKS